MNLTVWSSMLSDINLLSIFVRMGLAVLFGGIIGLERGANKHQAGLRTHILVCLGAALAMMTNQFAIQELNAAADPARLGAQVISGIGFLGAGLILVTSRNKVKGLTTAAGLWASACVGLAIGIGFYAGAILTAIFIFAALALMPPIENYFYGRSRVMDLLIEMESMNDLKSVLRNMRERDILILETQISRTSSLVPDGCTLSISIRIPNRVNHAEIIRDLSAETGVFFVEELG